MSSTMNRLHKAFVAAALLLAHSSTTCTANAAVSSTASRTVELASAAIVGSTTNKEEEVVETSISGPNFLLPLPSCPIGQHDQQHRQIQDSTTNPTDPFTLNRNGITHLSLSHTKLSTSLDGTMEASHGVEFSLENIRADAQHVILSGLGLHVAIDGDGIVPATKDVPTPCRVKVFTKLNTSGGNVDDSSSSYTLALDTKEVQCMGRTVETLVSEELFVQYYRDSSSNDDVEYYPLLIPSGSVRSFYIVVVPVDDDTTMNPFRLLSTEGSSSTDFSAYASDASLTLYEGTSVIDGYLVSVVENGGEGDADSNYPQVLKPTVFNGAIYYDTVSGDGSISSLEEYYLALEDSIHRGCDRHLGTGYLDTVGSYGLMFDVTSKAEVLEGDNKSKNVVIYGMDVYIRNFVDTRIEVYARKDSTIPDKYMSYVESDGQTRITENWDLIAKGTVEGQGPGVGSPIPPEAWLKNVVIEAGSTIGFYVTVLDDPHLRYRSSEVFEGNVYSSDDVLSIAVGRSWGEYPLKGDGTDVYFSQREFSGMFHYHAEEALCETEAPSQAPSKAVTTAPTPRATPEVNDDHCDLENSLATTYQDGTGSHGSLFDVLATTDITVTGIDLNVDWNSGDRAEVLVYARKGSWFGSQNDRDAWPHLLVNTTIYRPTDFHNRSTDGPYIPLEQKMASAVIPELDFKPLLMLEGETWAIYICMSLADMRYTLGTSIGKAYASNSQLQILEGAGAADFPPFGGGSTENMGAEYTFYAPRVFNGNLKYDYRAECPSAAPSALIPVTPLPTAVPTLTTSVRYQFYVEHSSDRVASGISQDMEYAVKGVIDGFLKDKKNALHEHANDDSLVISSVVASVSSPTEVGYLCIPTPPNVCNLITVNVQATHRSTASTEDVTYALLSQATTLPSLISVEGYKVEYVGNRAVDTTSEISLMGVPDRLMGETEAKYFENAALKFLNDQITKQNSGNYGSGDGALKILSVTINGQEILSNAASTDTGSSVPVPGRNTRRRLGNANKVSVSVKGHYRPPPELEIGEIVEDSINADRESFDRELKEARAPAEGGDLSAADLSYFEEIEVVGAREVKEVKDEEKPPLVTGIVIQTSEDSSNKAVLNMMAMGVGAMIAMLSLAFFLRPRRRAAMFGKKPKESHMFTQRVNAGDDFMEDEYEKHRSPYASNYQDEHKTPLNSSYVSSQGGALNASYVSNGQTLDSSGTQRQSLTLPLATSNRHSMRQSMPPQRHNAPQHSGAMHQSVRF